ncbi:MAG TPA: hypothetical protein VNA69_17945 [Thermoanaerobaculia bacterium]|nr:hypothetical protein [Thermoanaerobaculia bacterium]
MRFGPLVLLLLGACVSTSESIPESWLSVPEAPRIRSVSMDGAAARKTLDVRVETNAIGPRLVRGDRDLTQPFMSIDSFDVSESRGEVVFSAKRDDDFDVGLVSTDGSPISWVPAEEVDETGVKWAPRGNKIGYIVRGRSGDFVRVVHIPTSFQVANDFTYAKIHALAWDAAGDTLAVAYSTPDASDRVETMQYEGRERRVSTAPAATLDADLEPIGAGAVLLRRRDIRYGETLPLVVWIDDEPHAWSDARAELMLSARVGLIVTKQVPGDEFWRDVPPWIDTTRVYLVSGGQAIVPVPRGQTGLSVLHYIAADPALQGRQLRRTGNVVAVAPAVVQSFAARFIAAELKRITPPNGQSR